MKRNPVLFILMSVLFVARGYAGTNGILLGTVKEKQSRETLPGVNVFLVEVQRGTITDKNGYFEIQNVRAGAYEVRFSHIGFKSLTLKNVVINPDLRTKLNIQLEQTDVKLDEVIVVQEKPLIQRDITGTTFTVTNQEITLMPLDKVTDVIRLKPGVTAEGNVRGGKTTELVYLLDGLPVQDVMTGGFKTDIPNSSIMGLSLYTGGFEAEYGNALSGVVNIITKTGTSEHRFSLKSVKDNLFGGTQVSKSNEFEVSASGPLVEDKLFYLGSLNGVFTGTRWWQDLQYYFSGTYDRTWSGFAKLDYLFSPTLRLGGQVLFSDRLWHDYEFNWRFNLAGLPPENRRSYRIAAILSHTVSDNFFYTASLSKFYLKNSIGEGAKGDYVNSVPYQYDFFLRYIVDGQRAWWSRTTQESYMARFDGVWKPADVHMLKFGGDFVYYNIKSDLVKYEPRKTYFGKPLVNEPQLNFSSAYTYHPRQGSLYVQDKIDLVNEGVLINFGLRYDFLNPTATRPAIEEIPINDTSYANAHKPEVKASLKQQFSPRLGAAMQLTENGYLFVNLGWYIQYPLFDYLYTGLDRAGLARGVGALTGNPDLEPERTKSYEISVKYSLAHNIVVSATYFKKEMTNQIDTKTFISGDSKVAGTFGFAEFVNNPFAQATGLEVVVARERGEWLTGELSYTLMDAEGTSVSAYDGFYIAQYGLPPAIRVYPLSWDERHSVKLVTTVSTPWDLDLTVIAESRSGRPYTNYPTSTGFDPIDGGLFAANNARMPGNSNIDLKLSKYFTFDWWPNSRVTFYLDVRNLTNQKSVRWMDSNARIGGELGDPGGYFIGRRTYLGFIAEF